MKMFSARPHYHEAELQKRAYHMAACGMSPIQRIKKDLLRKVK